MHASTIETAWQNCCIFVERDYPDAVVAALKHAFFAGAGLAFLAVNDINASKQTTYSEKQVALAALYDEIDQFMRGRASPSATRQ